MLTSSSKQGMYSVIPGDSVYSKNGAVQHTVTTGYGTDGRISSAGFTHGGASKNFGYEYLSGSSLLHKLTMPCNMSLTQTYESTRDLLTGMAYHRGSTLVAQRTYTYDILGRPTARNTARNGQTVNDSFAHNSRSELAEATVSGKEYEYTYDNIGNRQFALEDSKATMYDTNGLNQYTAIAENGADAFVPQFDADGNQTLIKTATGIWSAVYNAENRPVSFTNTDTGTVVECAYDSQGRRAYKKVTVNGSVTLHQRYIYRGYLQIACCDLTGSGHPCLWLLTWDPTQPIATRPLAIRKDGTWYAYGWDLTKNICEVFGPAGYIRTAYTYSPYGQVTASGDVTQPIQWSSEVWDGELGLVYYNWRYYNALNGRWISRDIVQNNNIYVYCNNSVNINIDQLGASSFKEKNYKYIMLTIYKESEQPIDISPKDKKIIYSAAEEIVEELLMEILDNARVKILPSIDIINKLQLHGHSYWYLVYAYKCKNKDYWILGQSQVRGNGTNTGRDLYFFEHMQRREDKKGRLKKSLLEIDIEQTKNEILVMMSGACKECE